MEPVHIIILSASSRVRLKDLLLLHVCLNANEKVMLNNTPEVCMNPAFILSASHLAFVLLRAQESDSRSVAAGTHRYKWHRPLQQRVATTACSWQWQKQQPPVPRNESSSTSHRCTALCLAAVASGFCRRSSLAAAHWLQVNFTVSERKLQPSLAQDTLTVYTNQAATEQALHEMLIIYHTVKWFPSIIKPEVKMFCPLCHIYILKKRIVAIGNVNWWYTQETIKTFVCVSVDVLSSRSYFSLYIWTSL